MKYQYIVYMNGNKDENVLEFAVSHKFRTKLNNSICYITVSAFRRIINYENLLSFKYV